MPAEAWIALAGEGIVIVAALLWFERRLATAIADIAWLKQHAEQRRYNDEQTLGRPH